MPRPRSRALAFAGLMLSCLVVAVLLRWPYLQQPLDRDTALYATLGQRLGRGLLPYRDFFDHKQPLIYAVYWLIDVVAPQRVGSIRIAAAIPAGLAAALVAWTLAPRIGWTRALVAAALGLVLGAASVVQGGDLNTEHLLALTAALAVLPALAFQDSTWRWLPFALGLLAGVALMTKAVAALIVVAALVPLLAGRAARGQSALVTVAAWAAGAAVLPLVTLLFFVAIGAGDEFLFGNVTYNRSYVAGLHRTLLPSGLPDIARLELVALALGVVRLVAYRGRDVLGWTVMIWFLGAAAGAQISARAFAHYYATLIVPAAIIFALPLAPQRLLTRRAVAGTAIAAAAVLAALVTLPFVRALRDDLRATPSAIALKIYGPESEVWNRAFAVGDMLRREAAPGARLYVAGAEPEFYWTSGLPAASRYLYDYPALFTPDRFLPEVTEELCSRPPDLLVLPSGIFPAYAQGCINAGRYREVASSGAVRIYALRS